MRAPRIAVGNTPVQRWLSPACLALLLVACDRSDPPAAAPPAAVTAPAPAIATPYFGTLDPFASEAVYFVVTDRFVNGDPDNDFLEQGGARRSFDLPLPPCDGVAGNVGYLGGDFRGLLDNADYIAEMGFTAVWITPIIDNPDEAFSGGDPISCTSFLSDRGKAAYHGYWGSNFYRLDEHLPSADLDFAGLTQRLRAKGLKTVLDIVANHGSPGWTMATPQPGFGQLFDAQGRLIADHQNLPPEQLDPAGNPLHAFFNTRPDLAQLADFNANNPAVLDYLAGAYLQWIDQGAAAFRVDTIRHQPLGFWKAFSDRIREKHPGFYLFGEAFDYEADKIAAFTWPENGAISVLDFPLKKALDEVFTQPGSDFARLQQVLHLETGPYQNPYELTTFYDNHDMPRMNASDSGFIDAHHWLFTARGIPVIYYGSEMGFMRGRGEHAGNRAYFGSEGIAAARDHVIRQKLSRVARLRRELPALQRGLQLNLAFAGDQASFLRVLHHGDTQQTVLVLLNKGDPPANVALPVDLPAGRWRNALGGADLDSDGQRAQSVAVDGHDLAVFVLDGPIQGERWHEALQALMQRTVQRPAAAKHDPDVPPPAPDPHQ